MGRWRGIRSTGVCEDWLPRRSSTTRQFLAQRIVPHSAGPSRTAPRRRPESIEDSCPRVRFASPAWKPRSRLTAPSLRRPASASASLDHSRPLTANATTASRLAGDWSFHHGPPSELPFRHLPPSGASYSRRDSPAVALQITRGGGRRRPARAPACPAGYAAHARARRQVPAFSVSARLARSSARGASARCADADRPPAARKTTAKRSSQRCRACAHGRPMPRSVQPGPRRLLQLRPAAAGHAPCQCYCALDEAAQGATTPKTRIRTKSKLGSGRAERQGAWRANGCETRDEKNPWRRQDSDGALIPCPPPPAGTSVSPGFPRRASWPRRMAGKASFERARRSRS